jgi:hypothetical protein
MELSAGNFSPELLRKAAHIADESIGCKLTIRIDKNTSQAGTIVEARPGFGYYAGRSIGVGFIIVMECGINKVRKEFRVRKLPRREYGVR